jgi:hypothetical protein
MYNYAFQFVRIRTGMVNSTGMLMRCISGMALCFFAGCQGKPVAPMVGSYYLSPNADLSSLGRVALVELDNNSSYPEIAKNATDAIYVGLQKKQRFGLTVIPQNEAIWRSLQSEADSSYSPEQLLEMRKALKCDAVLTGAITQYEPYPHMSIGLRLRLIDMRSGGLLWAIEQVWDSADRSVSHRIKQHLKSQEGMGSGNEELVVMSPLRFLKFVGGEIAWTLGVAQENGSTYVARRIVE